MLYTVRNRIYPHCKLKWSPYSNVWLKIQTTSCSKGMLRKAIICAFYHILYHGWWQMFINCLHSIAPSIMGGGRCSPIVSPFYRTLYHGWWQMLINCLSILSHTLSWVVADVHQIVSPFYRTLYHGWWQMFTKLSLHSITSSIMGGGRCSSIVSPFYRTLYHGWWQMFTNCLSILLHPLSWVVADVHLPHSTTSSIMGGRCPPNVCPFYYIFYYG